MDEARFWEIVAEIGWPTMDYDGAKRAFMERYDQAVAEGFRREFGRLKRQIYDRAGLTAVSDSCDDNLAHIIGLGKDEYYRCMERPLLVREREDNGDYRESFAYCIPFEEDYGLLTDDGYKKYLRHVADLRRELSEADPDDVAPRLYRRFSDVIRVCDLLLERRWSDAVSLYHELFGEGYATDWPDLGYAVPNFIKTLEQYRL